MIRAHSCFRSAACMVWAGLLLGTQFGGPGAHAAEPGTAPANQVSGASNPAVPVADQAAVDGLLASARYWVRHQRDDLAVEQLRKALLILPGDPDALSSMGQIYVRTGNMAGAAHILEQLKEKDPGADGTRELDYVYRMAGPDKQKFATIQRLAVTGDPAAAVAQLEALFPLGPPTGALAGAYYDTLAQNPPDRARAIAALRDLVARHPDNLDASLTLASLLNREDSTRMQALEIVRRVVSDPVADRSQAFNVWRRVLRAAGDDPAYIDQLNAYLAVVPDDVEFKDLLTAAQARRQAAERQAADPYWQARQQGLRLLDAGGVENAQPLLEKALEGRPDDPQLLGGLGVLRMREGRHAAARDFFLKAARLDEDGREKWEGLADTALFWETMRRARDAAADGHPAQAEREARAALAMRPGDEAASGLLVDSLIAQKKWGQAEPMLRRQLSRSDLRVDTVRAMGEVLQQQGRAGEIPAMMAAAQKRLGGKELADLKRLHAKQLSDEADRLLAGKQTALARQKLEESLQYDPAAVWTRYTLARTYGALGLPKQARSVMEEGFQRYDTPEMSYAVALYRNAEDDTAGAQAALARVPESGLTDSMRALRDSLRARTLLSTAREQYRAGDLAGNERSLDEALGLVPGYPYIVASVADQWITQGQPDKGLGLLRDWLRKNMTPSDPQVGIRLRYGDLLANAGREDDLEAWLDQIRRIPGLTPEQQARLDDESLRRILRLTDAAISEEDYELAEHRLYQAGTALQSDPRWVVELADLRREQGRYAEARSALYPLLKAHPDNLDARLALARVQEQDGQRRKALALVRDVVQKAAPDDVDARLSASRRLVALRRPDEAAAVTDALRETVGPDSSITVQQGRISESIGHYDLAKADYQTALRQEAQEGVVPGARGTAAQRALDGLESRRQPMFEIGFMPSYDSGTPGVSDYRAIEVPMQVRIPYGYLGHWFIHADETRLDAGTLNMSSSYARRSFGTFATLPDDGADAPLVHSLHSRANGVALGAGFEADDWRVDLGTTPIGFPVTNIVGGLRFSVPNDYVGLRFNLSRRPVTSSVLSYAGVRDPVTGDTYGGVVGTGADVRISRDVGPADAFAQLGYTWYTGRNTATNQSFKLRTGFIVPVAQGRNWRLQSGLIGNYWHYSRNLDFYTYGQGGYYSPQRYLSIGLPLRWAARSDAWSWDLRGTVGYSDTDEKDSPFYPTSASLQSASGNRMHEGGPGGGFAYSLGGTLQYNFTPRIAAGISFSIDRSRDHAPSTVMLYFRYRFNPEKGPVDFPPDAVEPYSEF